jgi:probable F420-dependent oxidoreductase
MRESVRFAVGLPQSLRRDDHHLVRRFSSRAEELGFAGLWTLEGWFSATPLLDGLHLLSHAAAVTERVDLGAAVIVLPRRNPALLAKELATIDVLSGGRLVVGVGVGVVEERASGAGVPADHRVRRLREGLAAMKAFWSEGPASHDGVMWSFSDLPMEPKPVQRPHPPIWFGAREPVALRRAARLGDGWIGSGGSSTAQFREQLEVLKEALATLGRITDGFAIGKRVYIAVEDEIALAKEKLAEALDPMYDAPGMADRVGVAGSPEHCARALQAVVEAGATYLVLNPLYDHLEQLEALARVAELVRRRSVR